MTTEVVEATAKDPEVAQQAHTDEKQFLEGVSRRHEQLLPGLAAAEDEEEILEYRLSRGQDAADEAALKASLEAVRERVREVKKEIRKLEIVQRQSRSAVDRKAREVKLAEQEKAIEGYLGILEPRVPDAEVVDRLSDELVKALWKLSEGDRQAISFAMQAGLKDSEINRMSRRVHIPYFLAGKFAVFLGRMVDRPHKVYRDSTLASIEEDLARANKQDLDRARRRLASTFNGAPNGTTDNE